MVDMDGHSMPADVTSSQFFHKLDSPSVKNSAPATPETSEILAQALDVQVPYLAIIVVMSVLASILICGLVIGLVLYRRRTTGMYPKGSLTLASPLKSNKNAEHNTVVPRGFPRVGINDQHSNAQLSPTVPRSKRQNRNADAW